MAGEAAGFLSPSLSENDLDIELVDEKMEFFQQGRQRARFGSKVRLAIGGTVACAFGWVVLMHRQPTSKGSNAAFLRTVELDGVPVAAARSLLKPVERMHDGNVCDANEELFGGLCYQKCSLLTHGEASIRTSVWTCCKEHPCSLTNQKGNIGSSLLHSLGCNGFGVSGQGGCPHKPGACLLNEELHVGLCYKKCALLTNGTNPFRTAAATCCKTQGLKCLDARNAQTSRAFDVGGGSGDHDASTPAEAHPPQKRLTESGEPVVSSTTATPAPQQFVSDAHFEPVENLHDGNTCDDQEELFGGLCYKKCSILTNGDSPIRTSSWTCCKSHPCGFWNQKHSLGNKILCSGFDVSADGSCPHKPGACLVNEEMVLGVCYQQCSLLTAGSFPYRVAAATCCKTHGVGCLDPRNVKTSDAFARGGDRNHSTAHLPDESLTEAGAHSAKGTAMVVRNIVSTKPALTQAPAQVPEQVPKQVVARDYMASELQAQLEQQPEMPENWGSAVPKPRSTVAQQPTVADAEALRQAKDAQEAQEAVQAMVASMRK